MGFSVVIASAILFSAALIFSAVIYDSLDNSLQELRESEEERHDMNIEKLNTRISIIDVTVENNEVRIEASNTGNTIIILEKDDLFLLDVLVNGSLTSDRITGYMVENSGSTFWGPGEDIIIYLRFVKMGDGTSISLITPQGERSDYKYYEPLRAYFTIRGMQTPYVFNEDEVYEFIATPPQGDRDDISYYWEFGDGSSGAGPAVEHAFSQPGTYRTRLMIVSTSGESAEHEAQVEITDTTVPNAVILAISHSDEGTSIHLTAQTWDNVDIISWSWDFGDGSSGSGAEVDHIYDSPDLYTILLTVSDDAGNSYTTAHQIMIKDNTPPSCKAGSDISSRVGIQVYFDGSGSSDPKGGRIIGYTWDFDDGHFGSGEYTSHEYSEPGDYTVILRIMDLEGHTSTDSLRVSIDDARGV